MPGVCSSTLSNTATILETIKEEEIQPMNVTQYQQPTKIPGRE